MQFQITEENKGNFFVSTLSPTFLVVNQIPFAAQIRLGINKIKISYLSCVHNSRNRRFYLCTYTKSSFKALQSLSGDIYGIKGYIPRHGLCIIHM